MFETTDETLLLSAASADAQLPADYSSPEIMISNDAQNKERSAAAPDEESVDNEPAATLLPSSDPQKVDNEETSANEENLQEEEEEQAELQKPLEDLSMAVKSADRNYDLTDTYCAKKDTAVINEESEEGTVIDNGQEEIGERTDDADDFIDDTFVSVELSSSPTKNSSSYEEVVEGQQEQSHPSVLNSTTAAGMTTSFEEVITDAAIGTHQTTATKPAATYIPSSTSNNNATTTTTKSTTSSLNITQPPTTAPTTRRRKILHHPILSHLTKLPWDRLSNAGSACDIIFNCKYSMRQVEDEVREECRRGVSGEGVYIEDNNDRVGREDGYVNVSLNSCSDYQYQEEGCEAGDFEQILGCCSMLDNDEETDDDDDEDEEECVLPENNDMSQKVPHLGVQPMMMGLEASRHATADTNQEGGEGERELSGDNRMSSNNHELQQQQQSDKSWQQTNPSLDMMLYRQFLNE